MGSDDEDGSDDRQKLMRGDPDAVERDTEHQQEHNSTSTTNTTQRTPIQRRVTELPVFAPTTLSRHQPRSNNDGVFANLAAKPERGETTGDEKPPVRILNILSHLSDRTPQKADNSCLHIDL